MADRRDDVLVHWNKRGNPATTTSVSGSGTIHVEYDSLHVGIVKTILFMGGETAIIFKATNLFYYVDPVDLYEYTYKTEIDLVEEMVQGV